MCSGPYCEMHCNAVCTWKLWDLPLLWFVYERNWLDLINLQGFYLSCKQFANAEDSWRTIKGYCFLSKILQNHLLSEHMQWSYASFNVTRNRLMSTSSKRKLSNCQKTLYVATHPILISPIETIPYSSHARSQNFPSLHDIFFAS